MGAVGGHPGIHWEENKAGPEVKGDSLNDTV